MLKRFLIVGIVLVAFVMFAFSVNKVTKNESSLENEVSANVKALYEPIVVLELFTSQGCSSCPAADRLLNEVKTLHPDNVFTLSYHVDYWNYIGWKDPFSKPVYAEKQSEYNSKLKYRGNYTPEVVVNGKAHFTGSNRAKMNTAITRFKSEKAENQVSIVKFEQKDGKLAFDYEIEGSIDGKILRAVVVLDERTTAVKRGENRNRTIKNSNIVVAENRQILTEGKGNIEVGLPEIIKDNEKVSLLLLVSNSELDITAAVRTGFVK